MPITIEDLAKTAGVSVGDVEKVQKIWDAAVQLGYVSPINGVLPHTREAGFRLKFLLPKGPSEFLNQIERAVDSLESNGPWRGPMASWQRIPDSSHEEMAAAIVDAAEDADGIGVAAHDDPLIRDAIQTVVRRGVPVVTLFTDIDHCGRLAYVGIDNWSAGRAAAYLLSRFLTQKDGSVGVVTASQTFRGQAERLGAFSQVLGRECPNLTVAAVREAWGEVDESYEQTRRILSENADLVAIYSIGGGRQETARALRDSGRAAEVVLIVHELTEGIRPYVLDGTVDAVIDTDAKRAVDIATRWLLDHKVARPKSSYLTDRLRFEIYFRENLPD